ncbi:MAG: abortive infection family protein [Proteiniphilum sp.]|nr:abortive infection family protein [Bacteroidaceae bacterium]MDD3076448.1 abortive infection family protein [Proteiniphilum sp.]
MKEISPRYQMSIVQNINDRLFEFYKSYEDVANYLDKWHIVYDCYGDNENFYFFYKDEERKKLDVKKTLHHIDGETLLKIAIDLGVETPDYIPSIPVFKNELKSSYETASQTFEKAFKNVEEDPSLAVGLANSALESIIKEILKDDRIDVEWNEKDTLSNLIKSICKAFKLTTDSEMPNEIKTISSSLLNACKAIDDLRSDKTIFHGKMDSNYVLTEPLYAYFIVNAVSTVGLFLLNFYKLRFPQIVKPVIEDIDDLPF